MRHLRLTAILLLVALAGCGGSDDDGDARAGFESVLGEIDGLDTGARERKLRELAREEGNELNVYTSLIDESQKAVTRVFERRYGIDVTVFRSEGEAIAQRVSEEAKAGRRGTDVIETGAEEMVGLNGLGVLVPYEPAALAGLAGGSRQEGWTATRFQRFVVAWNTKLLESGEQPRSLEELAKPRWRGKVALEASDSDWYKALRDHWTEEKSEREADRLLEGIAGNARVTSSHAVMSELLGAGNFTVAASTYLHLTRDSIAKGAPVAFEPIVEPVVTRPNGVGLLETADHPAAAVLFVEWLLTDGQELLQQNNIEPSRKDLDRLDVREVPVDVDALAEDAQEWKDRYDELLRGAKRADG